MRTGQNRSEVYNVEPYLFHSYILVTEDCNVSLNTWTERENISREDVWSKNVVALEMMEWLIFLQSNLDGSERTVAVLYRTSRSTDNWPVYR